MTTQAQPPLSQEEWNARYEALMKAQAERDGETPDEVRRQEEARMHFPGEEMERDAELEIQLDDLINDLELHPELIPPEPKGQLERGTESLRPYRNIVVVAGTRWYADVRQFHRAMCMFLLSMKGPVVFVTGKAPSGADDLIIRWCRKFGYPWVEYEADWDNNGKAAGFIRNKEMSEIMTHLVTFWDGDSPGTMDMINLGVNKNVPVKVLLIAKPSRDKWYAMLRARERAEQNQPLEQDHRTQIVEDMKTQALAKADAAVEQQLLLARSIRSDNLVNDSRAEGQRLLDLKGCPITDDHTFEFTTREVTYTHHWHQVRHAGSPVMVLGLNLDLYNDALANWFDVPIFETLKKEIQTVVQHFETEEIRDFPPGKLVICTYIRPGVNTVIEFGSAQISLIQGFMGWARKAFEGTEVKIDLEPYAVPEAAIPVPEEPVFLPVIQEPLDFAAADDPVPTDLADVKSEVDEVEIEPEVDEVEIEVEVDDE